MWGPGVLKNLRYEVWQISTHSWAEDAGSGVPMVEVFCCSPVAELRCGTWRVRFLGRDRRGGRSTWRGSCSGAEMGLVLRQTRKRYVR